MNRTISTKFDSLHRSNVTNPQFQKGKIAYGVSLDKTRNMIHELQESHAQYAELYDYAPVGYFQFDNMGQILHVNLTGAALLKKERDSLIGKPFSQFIHREDQDVFSMYLQSVLKAKNRKSCELRLKIKRTVQTHFRLESVPVRRNKGCSCQIRTIVTDITKQKQYLRVLKESEKRYRNLIDNTLVGIFTTNVKGDILSVNDSVVKIYEFDSAEEMISKGVKARYKNPKDRKKLFDQLRQAGKVDGYELEVLTKDGTSKNVLLSAHLDGDILSGLVMDITKRKQDEEELKKHRTHLLHMVDEQTADLKLLNRELEESNIALKVLLNQRVKDKSEFEENIVSNMNQLIMPYIAKLKKNRNMSEELSYLNIIESNLKEIMSTFSVKLSSSSFGFTSRELQLANLIKDGQKDKDIMEILNISLDTVKAHRKNIRKKLCIYNTRTNLRSTLLDLIE